jgi:hypothetical protein
LEGYPLKNRIVALVVTGVLLTGSLGFAEVITPTISLAKQNSGYEVLMLTKAKVDLTIINSRVVENRLNATLDQFEKLRDKGMHISVMQEFPVRLSLLSTVEQIDYGIEMMTLNARVTEYSLYLALRDIYMGLYQSYEKYLITEEKMVLKNDIYSMDLDKYKLGQISDVELMQSEINKMEAYVDYVESLDNYRIMLETFNKFIGNDNIYEVNTLKNEQPVEITYENIDYYVDRALTMRSEMVDINRQIEIENMKKELYEDRNGVYLRIEDFQEDYKDLLDDIWKLEVEKVDIVDSITLEIMASYNGVMITKENMVTLKSTVDEQLERLEHLKLQYELGYVTKNTYKEVELGIKELVLNYELAVMNYNSQLYKFVFASSAGPSSQGGR